ncbi:MAG: hypothetical protein OXB86_03185 [Bdellovibrionales bacterium]|nr:hypothetical protein [Bdellovibrionales bacterium]
MKNPINFLTVLCLCLFSIGNCRHSPPPLTKDRVQEISQKPAQNDENLIPGTFEGCVFVPATDFFQKLMVGFKITGEACSATVHQDNTISVDFLGSITTKVFSTSTKDIRTDVFIGELGNNQVLIVQHHQGKAVSVTQTIYDDNGTVVYGKFGEGDYIKECHLLKFQLNACS